MLNPSKVKIEIMIHDEVNKNELLFVKIADLIVKETNLKFFGVLTENDKKFYMFNDK